MTIDNWIMIISALIVAIGWFVTWHLEQQSEIAKEKRSYRLDMLHSFYPIIFLIQNNKHNLHDKEVVENLSKLFANARSKFLLYGYEDEIEAYESVVSAFEGDDDKLKIDCLNKVADIARKKIRTELSLPAHVLSRKQTR